VNTDTAIPPYVLERVRRSIPPSSMVVPGSTPVVAFGNARRATVATLGLNPSRVEFLDRHGQEFTESQRRLETCRSLGVAQLADAPDDIVERVVAGCDGYFQRNPYWRWFLPLEQVLQGVGVSYTDGSACHLDLIQWATDPVWGKLPTRQDAVVESSSRRRTMKACQHTAEQIIKILEQAEKDDQTIGAVCRTNGIAENTFYRWGKTYAGMSVSEAQRLKELEKEDARLKRLLDDRMLEVDALKELLKKG
jgi:transposase-like protein